MLLHIHLLVQQLASFCCLFSSLEHCVLHHSPSSPSWPVLHQHCLLHFSLLACLLDFFLPLQPCRFLFAPPVLQRQRLCSLSLSLPVPSLLQRQRLCSLSLLVPVPSLLQRRRLSLSVPVPSLLQRQRLCSLSLSVPVPSLLHAAAGSVLFPYQCLCLLCFSGSGSVLFPYQCLCLLSSLGFNLPTECDEDLPTTNCLQPTLAVWARGSYHGVGDVPCKTAAQILLASPPTLVVRDLDTSSRQTTFHTVCGHRFAQGSRQDK